MDAFSHSAGLDSWNDQTQPWENRGTEHAAEIIAWALMERAPTIRYLEYSGAGPARSVFRLLTIDDVTALDLYHGFVLLTGMEPMFRTATDWDPELLEVEWQERMGSVTSPEVWRVRG